jgi:hypothetical protein
VRGSAVEFGADPAGIHITTGPTLNAVTGPLTVAAWTRVVGTEAYGIILSNDRDCCGTYNGFSLYASHYNTGPAMLTWAGTQSVASGAPLPPDTWVHVVGTFDGSNVRVYVDGTEVASATGAIGAPPSFDLWLGTMAYVEPFTHIHGAIDEVLILGRALAPAEIVALRAAYSPP